MPRPRIRPRRRPLDPADPVLARRGVQPREAARRPQPGDLRRPSRCRRSTTSTARSATPSLNPIDMDPLPRAAVPGDEADDRLRRRQPAAAEDAPARHPPAGHRGGARPRRRGRRRRRPPHRRPRPAPPDDRGRAAPRRRRPRLRRLRADRRCCTSTTPRTPTASASSAPPTRARRSRSTSGRPSPTSSSTSTSTSWRWTAAGSRRRSGSPRTARCATTTTRRRWRPAAASWTSHHSELHNSTWRMGKVLRDAGIKVFQIETTLNTDTFPKPFEFLSKREWEWIGTDRALVPRHGEVAASAAGRARPARSSTRSRRRTR